MLLRMLLLLLLLLLLLWLALLEQGTPATHGKSLAKHQINVTHLVETLTDLMSTL